MHGNWQWLVHFLELALGVLCASIGMEVGIYKSAYCSATDEALIGFGVYTKSTQWANKARDH